MQYLLHLRNLLEGFTFFHEAEGERMEVMIGVAVLIGIAWYFYKSGKRIGSRKGYHAGRSCTRRRR